MGSFNSASSIRLRRFRRRADDTFNGSRIGNPQARQQHRLPRAHRAARFWCSEMLKRGVYVHPWHNMFLSAAMTASDIDFALGAAEGSFETLKAKRASLGPVQKLQALFASLADPDV